MIQGSADWFQAKIGKVGASRIKDVMATVKNGEAAARRNYRAELVAARLTGEYPESYCSAEMQWGSDNEDTAREVFSFVTGLEVETCGFIEHPTIAMAGASPDGLTSDGAVLELKCPKTATHMEYLIANRTPSEHIYQVQWQMACTGKKKAWFASYDPRLPERGQLFYIKSQRDNELIKEIETEVVKFLAEVDIMEAKLREIMGG